MCYCYCGTTFVSTTCCKAFIAAFIQAFVARPASLSRPLSCTCVPVTCCAQTLLPDQSSWFNTGVYSLELLIHQRLRRHPCLTKDPTRAQLFYIPFYACECPAQARAFTA